MAMIGCPECGKQISDKAVSCPNCGCAVSSAEKCAECGTALTKNAVSCPVCGCPVKSSAAAKNSKKGKGGIIAAAIIGAAAIIAAAVFCIFKFAPNVENDNVQQGGTDTVFTETENKADTEAQTFAAETAEQQTETSAVTQIEKADDETAWVTKRTYNSGYYTGEWKNNMPDGFGAYTETNVDDYKIKNWLGNWTDGKIDGEALFSYVYDSGTTTFGYERIKYSGGSLDNEKTVYAVEMPAGTNIPAMIFLNDGEYKDGSFYNGHYMFANTLMPYFSYDLYEEGSIAAEYGTASDNAVIGEAYADGYYSGEWSDGEPYGYGKIDYKDDMGTWLLGGCWSGGYIQNEGIYAEVYYDDDNGKCNGVYVGNMADSELAGYGVRFWLYNDGYAVINDGTLNDNDIFDGIHTEYDSGCLTYYCEYRNGEIIEEYKF